MGKAPYFAAAGTLLVGCTELPKRVATPLSATPGTIQLCPHEVEYQLLSVATGKACAAPSMIAAYAGKPSASRDPDATGSAFLFELAKFDAIYKVPDADNLLEVRSKVDFNEQGECVTVVGRAYRITSIRATCSSGSHPAPALQGAASVSTPH